MTELLIALIPFFVAYVMFALVTFGMLYGLDIYMEERGDPPTTLLSKVMWSTFWPFGAPIIIGTLIMVVILAVFTDPPNKEQKEKDDD